LIVSQWIIPSIFFAFSTSKILWDQNLKKWNSIHGLLKNIWKHWMKDSKKFGVEAAEIGDLKNTA